MRHGLIMTGAVLAVTVTVGLAWRTFFPATEAPKPPAPEIVFLPNAPTITSDDPKRGDARATHVLVEFGDFGCASCREVAPVVEQVLAEHPDTMLVWKDAPNEAVHFSAMQAALAGRCAALQGKFWSFHDAMFAEAGLSPNIIQKAVTELKLDETRYQECVSAEETRKRLEATLRLAEILGIDGTPFFFLDGKPLGTILTVEEFEKAFSK